MSTSLQEFMDKAKEWINVEETIRALNDTKTGREKAHTKTIASIERKLKKEYQEGKETKVHHRKRLQLYSS
jgi:hypothetical protein